MLPPPASRTIVGKWPATPAVRTCSWQSPTLRWRSSIFVWSKLSMFRCSCSEIGRQAQHDRARPRVDVGGVAEIGRAHSELQSLMRISYAVFCLKKKNTEERKTEQQNQNHTHKSE